MSKGHKILCQKMFRWTKKFHTLVASIRKHVPKCMRSETPEEAKKRLEEAERERKDEQEREKRRQEWQKKKNEQFEQYENQLVKLHMALYDWQNIYTFCKHFGITRLTFCLDRGSCYGDRIVRRHDGDYGTFSDSELKWTKKYYTETFQMFNRVAGKLQYCFNVNRIPFQIAFSGSRTCLIIKDVYDDYQLSSDITGLVTIKTWIGPNIFLPCELHRLSWDLDGIPAVVRFRRVGPPTHQTH